MSNANRYRGRTPGQAMKKARQELGDDARLVSARRVSAPDAPPVYEVHVISGDARATETATGLDALRREIETLRRTLTPVAEAPKLPSDPMRDRLLDLLRRRGVEGSTAERLAERAVDSGAGRGEEPLAMLHAALAAELDGGIREPLADRSTVFVGPSGAGKTTVLTKIATQLVSNGESPLLIAADGESVAGEDTLEAIATALGLRLETAFLPGRLTEIVEDSAADTVFLVDPPGRTPFERDGLGALAPIIDAVPGAEVLPVLPATIDAEEARLLMDGYSRLGARRAVLTKLDELARPGRIVDLVRTLSHPVAWVTFGRGARGAGSGPADSRVVERVLGTTLALEKSA